MTVAFTVYWEFKDRISMWFGLESSVGDVVMTLSRSFWCFHENLVSLSMCTILGHF